MKLEEIKKAFAGFQGESLKQDLKVQKAAKVITESAKVVEK